MQHTFTLLIPAFNEENALIRALASVKNQQLPEDVSLRIVIMPNGCTDRTEELARSWVAQQKTKNQSWEVLPLATPSKTKTLNTGFDVSDTEIVMYMDADSYLAPETLAKMYYALTKDQDLQVVGAFWRADFANSDKTSLLYQVQATVEQMIETSGFLLPIGRCVGFKRAAIDHLPTNVGNEDHWLALKVMESHGIESVRVLLDAPIFYKPTLHWIDYIKQESRIMRSDEQIFELYPNLQQTYLTAQTAKFIPLAERLPTLTGWAEQQGIPAHRFDEYYDVVLPILQDHADLMHHQLLDKDGRWEPVKTTK